jgi:hypothetical protein
MLRGHTLPIGTSAAFNLLSLEDNMAVYDPPQPLWKRNVAGILDFFLAAIVFGLLLWQLFGSAPHAPVMHANGTTTTEVFSLGPWPTLLLVAMTVVYFVALGRTGGTIFQRLFGMKRAK